MSVWILTVAAAAAVSSLSLQAQLDFDKVALAPAPRLADTATCVQSQAAAIAVSTPPDLPLQFFRRGYCALAGAAITGDSREYLAAALDFDRAIAAWPGRMYKAPKNQAPEPVPGVLRVLPWVARLHAGVAAPRPPETDTPVCSSYLMGDWQCGQIAGTGRQWLGWFALGERRLDDAARDFAGAPETGWLAWAEGQRLFDQARYAEAAAAEQRAVAVWKSGTPSLLRRLSPTPNVATALADLGGAQLLAGQPREAIATLDASLRARPDNPQALFRRARAHELAGEPDAALADYNLASRAAFAAARDLASGDAHLFRGILLYRRGDFVRAENEFASAMNFEIAGPLRADAQAWRHLAAIAGGSCAESGFLDRALPRVSPYFPKQEALRAAAKACYASG